VYTHELKLEIVRALSAIPQVQQVNHLQVWGEQVLYVLVRSGSPAVRAQVDAVLQGVARAWRGLQPARLSWRVLNPGEPVPASPTLFRRDPTSPMPTEAP